MTANMSVEIADEVLGKIAESLGLGDTKAPKKLVMEVKIIIRVEPTEKAVAKGGAAIS